MLTRSRINQLSGEAQTAFCLNKQPTYEVALAGAVEAEVRNQDTELIRGLAAELQFYRDGYGISDDSERLLAEANARVKQFP